MGDFLNLSSLTFFTKEAKKFGYFGTVFKNIFFKN